MLRLAVALIVVTLTGLPVVPAICLSWCVEHKTTTEYCHDEAVGNGAFIREDARPVLHTVQYLTAARTATMATTAAAHSVSVVPRQHTVLASPAPPLVLRV